MKQVLSSQKWLLQWAWKLWCWLYFYLWQSRTCLYNILIATSFHELDVSICRCACLCLRMAQCAFEFCEHMLLLFNFWEQQYGKYLQCFIIYECLCIYIDSKYVSENAHFSSGCTPARRLQHHAICCMKNFHSIRIRCASFCLAFNLGPSVYVQRAIKLNHNAPRIVIKNSFRIELDGKQKVHIALLLSE
jgi:hypothetical protein